MRTAALYMRMSTERQDYSIKHQRYALEIYAAANDIIVVREYCDEGKSGLALKGRDGLRAAPQVSLLASVFEQNPIVSFRSAYGVYMWWTAAGNNFSRQ